MFWLLKVRVLMPKRSSHFDARNVIKLPMFAFSIFHQFIHRLDLRKLFDTPSQIKLGAISSGCHTYLPTDRKKIPNAIDFGITKKFLYHKWFSGGPLRLQG